MIEMEACCHLLAGSSRGDQIGSPEACAEMAPRDLASSWEAETQVVGACTIVFVQLGFYFTFSK